MIPTDIALPDLRYCVTQQQYLSKLSIISVTVNMRRQTEKLTTSARVPGPEAMLKSTGLLSGANEVALVLQAFAKARGRVDLSHLC